MKTIFCVSLAISPIVILGINASYAQSLDNFVTYTDNEKKFTTKHPSDWKIKKPESFPDDV
jgi:hypothetical protein